MAAAGAAACGSMGGGFSRAGAPHGWVKGGGRCPCEGGQQGGGFSSSHGTHPPTPPTPPTPPDSSLRSTTSGSCRRRSSRAASSCRSITLGRATVGRRARVGGRRARVGRRREQVEERRAGGGEQSRGGAERPGGRSPQSEQVWWWQRVVAWTSTAASLPRGLPDEGCKEDRSTHKLYMVPRRSACLPASISIRRARPRNRPRLSSPPPPAVKQKPANFSLWGQRTICPTCLLSKACQPAHHSATTATSCGRTYHITSSNTCPQRLHTAQCVQIALKYLLLIKQVEGKCGNKQR